MTELMFLEKLILFTVLFLVMLFGHILYEMVANIFWGSPLNEGWSLSGKDKYTAFLIKNKLWAVPFGALCIGLVTATVITLFKPS